MLNERSEFFANSVWRVIYYLLVYRWGWPTEIAHKLNTGLPNWLFITGALLIPLWMFNILPKRWRNTPVIVPAEAERRLWRSLTAISILYLLVGSFWFQHWYVLWVIAPAVLLPDSRFTRSLLPWLVFGALSSNMAMSFLLERSLKTAPRIVSYISVVAMIWGPVLIAFSVFMFTRWWGKRKSTLQSQQPYG
jgi:hypothetical protein